MTAWIGGVTLDCRDALFLAEFWASALTWDLAPWSGSQGALITSRREPGFRIGFASVPERKVERNRFHLDLETEQLRIESTRMRALGAIVLAEHRGEGWDRDALTDPEGNEFYLGRVTGWSDGNATAPTGRGPEWPPVWIGGFGFECRDPGRLSAFWSELLGFQVVGQRSGGTLIQHPEPGRRWMWFQQVAEEKAAKNRVHPDLESNEYLDEVRRARELGATVVAEHRDDLWEWDVMQDPEGNEFCLGRSRAPTGA